MDQGLRQYVRSWWQQPFDFDWTARHFRANGVLRLHQVAIGFFAGIYGLTALLAVVCGYTDDGAVGAQVVVAAVCVSSIVLSLLWTFGPWPTEGQSIAFAVYADVAVAVVIACFHDSFTAMPGLALLAANGIYVVLLHGPRALLLHLLLTIVAFGWVTVMTLHQAEAPLTLIVIRVLVLFPTVVALPVLVQSYLLTLRVAAADALVDPLTRLHNRRGLDAELVELALEPSSPVGVLAIDIDKFKAINDGHGHDTGDRVIVAVANATRDTVAALDVAAVIARTGGEEFVVIVCAEPFTASRLADLLHDAVARIDTAVVPTVSIGLAISGWADDGIRGLIERADAAMYAAKNSGGGQTVLAAGVP